MREWSVLLELQINNLETVLLVHWTGQATWRVGLYSLASLLTVYSVPS